jgi:hypothetical protein
LQAGARLIGMQATKRAGLSQMRGQCKQPPASTPVVVTLRPSRRLRVHFGPNRPILRPFALSTPEVHRRYTGGTPDALGIFRCTSGVHPVYLRCTRSGSLSGPAGLQKVYLNSLFFLPPSSLLVRPVSRRRCPGGALAMPRCVSHVDTKSPNVCRASVTIFALRVLTFALAAHSLPTQYCCPVRGDDWPRRFLVCNFAPAAIQASSLEELAL